MAILHPSPNSINRPTGKWVFGEIKHKTKRQGRGITVDDVIVHACYDLPEQSNWQGACFETGAVRGIWF